MNYEVKKRDGKLVPFKMDKISEAMKKAFDSEEVIIDSSTMELLSLRVVAQMSSYIKEGIISVEDIQDAVEVVLIQTGYVKVARAYILYRRQRKKARDAVNTLIDYSKIVNDYVKVEDWRVKENSTVTYSVGGLILSNSVAITANYW